MFIKKQLRAQSADQIKSHTQQTTNPNNRPTSDLRVKHDRRSHFCQRCLHHDNAIMAVSIALLRASLWHCVMFCKAFKVIYDTTLLFMMYKTLLLTTPPLRVALKRKFVCLKLGLVLLGYVSKVSLTEFDHERTIIT